MVPALLIPAIRRAVNQLTTSTTDNFSFDSGHSFTSAQSDLTVFERLVYCSSSELMMMMMMMMMMMITDREKGVLVHALYVFSLP